MGRKIYTLDFVFGGVNYIVDVDGTYEDYTINRVDFIDEQGDIQTVDGDLDSKLMDTIGNEYAERLSEGTGY